MTEEWWAGGTTEEAGVRSGVLCSAELRYYSRMTELDGVLCSTPPASYSTPERGLFKGGFVGSGSGGGSPEDSGAHRPPVVRGGGRGARCSALLASCCDS